MLKTQDLEAGVNVETQAIETVRRRRAPRFVIVDEHGDIFMTSGDPGRTLLEDINLSAVFASKLIAQLEGGAVTEAFAVISPTTILRATELSGGGARYYALFVEHVESRDLLANAAERFSLSTREIDVLRLVLHGMSTAEIAQRLCIAATTVHAHVKNIARKTKSTKRTEILAKLLGVR